MFAVDDKDDKEGTYSGCVEYWRKFVCTTQKDCYLSKRQ